jgi:hypothetical protein
LTSQLFIISCFYDEIALHNQTITFGSMHPKKRWCATEVAQLLQNSDEEDLDVNNYDSNSEISEESQSSSDEDETGDLQQNRRVRKPAGKQMKQFTWGNVKQMKTANFTSNNTGPTNLTKQFTENDSAAEFFNIFWGDEIWQNLVDKTNVTAVQKLQANPNSYYAKNWYPTTVTEMKAFLAVRISMEMMVYKPRYEKYWCTKENRWISHTPGYAQVFTRDRFLSIWSFLHIVDEDDKTLDKTDKIYKIRPLLNILLSKFQNHYIPCEELSLDEGMIPTKNRLAIKQYLKDKPIKWGIKSFLLCESNSGYVWNIEIYTGKNDAQYIEELGATGSVVIRLVSPLQGQNYCIFMDRYYNSPRLCDYLLKLQFKTCGTVMTNRKEFPKNMIKSKKDLKKMKKGDYEVMYTDGIAAVMWLDRKPIYFLTTAYDPEKIVHVNRLDTSIGRKVPVQCPEPVQKYNEFMGGTDRNDQVTKIQKIRRHFKWPRRLVVKCFMWACYNSYVVEGFFKPHYPVGKRPRLFQDFVEDLVDELIGGFRRNAPVRDRLTLAPERQVDVGQHFPERSPGESRNHTCVVCREKHNRFMKKNPGTHYSDNPNKKKKTVFWCKLCQEYLCIGSGKENCFQIWHTKSKYWK